MRARKVDLPKMTIDSVSLGPKLAEPSEYRIEVLRQASSVSTLLILARFQLLSHESYEKVDLTKMTLYSAR
jgi:hypothetical protein